MTGFARVTGALPPLRWVWELKSVNGRGLDLRLRLPPGFDAMEPAARAALGEALARGNCTANLTLVRDGAQAMLRVNEASIAAVAAALDALARRFPEAAPPSLDGILALRGVLDTAEADEAVSEEQQRAVLDSLRQGVAALAGVRREEGTRLAAVLLGRLAEIARLTEAADALPGRRPERIRARLAEALAELLANADGLDPNRLHQEAALLAVKSDVREELDRLRAHVASAQNLVETGGPVGRRLDFLAQELAREANTLCAKSDDLELTAIGLELKVVVDQFREQAQNVE
jgi:uncharacterized protein (TIGR00255 family)